MLDKMHTSCYYSLELKLFSMKKHLLFLLVILTLSFLVSSCSSDEEKKQDKTVHRITLISNDTSVVVHQPNGENVNLKKPVSMQEITDNGINPLAIAEAEAHKGQLIEYPKKGIMEKIKEEVGDDEIFKLIELLVAVLIVVLIIRVVSLF